MKTKQTVKTQLDEASKKALIEEAALKLKDKVLFKEKIEEAKSFLEKATFSFPIK